MTTEASSFPVIGLQTYYVTKENPFKLSEVFLDLHVLLTDIFRANPVEALVLLMTSFSLRGCIPTYFY